MLSKKSILWTLTLVAVVACAAAIWQNRTRHQRKTAAAVEAKARKLKSNDSDEGAADKHSPPAPKKAPKVTVLGQAAKEHLAEKAFIAALRAVFIWRSQQSETPEIRRSWLEKLAAIACEDLPPERKHAWQSLLAAWQSVSAPGKAMDPRLQEQGQRAAETLNAMFKVHGDGDIVL